jgi:hypothetical protein
MTGAPPEYPFFSGFFTPCWKIANSWALSSLVFVAIVACAIVDGMATYPMFKCKQWNHYFNIVVTFIFLFECIVKILAEGNKPYRYFIGLESLRMYEIRSLKKTIQRLCRPMDDQLPDDPDDKFGELDEEEEKIESDYCWNIFDTSIVILCLYGITMFCQEGYGTIRVFRLLRIMKLLRYWKQLQDILRGLIGGLRASSSILLLFGFVFFLFGSIGVIQFGRNDPFHFGNLQRAMWTMYKISNMEWLDVSDTALYGCDGSVGYGYSVFINEDHDNFDHIMTELKGTKNFFDSSVVIMGFLTEFPVTNKELVYRIDWYGGFTEGVEYTPTGGTGATWNWGQDEHNPHPERIYYNDADWEDMEESEFWCAPLGHAKMMEDGAVMGPPYFILYIVVAGLILVTLFTGAVSVSMTLAVIEIRKEEQDKQSAKAKAAEDALLQKMNASFSKRFSSRSLKSGSLGPTGSPEVPVSPSPEEEIKRNNCAYLLRNHTDRAQVGLVSADRKRYIAGQRLTLWCLDPEAALPGTRHVALGDVTGTPAPGTADHDSHSEKDARNGDDTMPLKVDLLGGNKLVSAPNGRKTSVVTQNLFAKRSGASGMNLDARSIREVRKKLDARVRMQIGVCTLLCSSKFTMSEKVMMLLAEISQICFLVSMYISRQRNFQFDTDGCLPLLP